MAVQYQVFSRATAFAELFHDEKGPGKYQVGARYAFVLKRVEAFASYGNEFASGSENWWATVGIRINTAVFLP
ncbi:MAG TPA: hypothetical protein VMK32_04390 [Burkholderiaceae bacterium]|nr:hypothetical protein [Burkholderiaceae bacterium]